MAGERQAFDEQKEVTNTKGLKISNNNSKYTKIAEDKASFNERADDLMTDKKIRNKRAAELVSQFISIVKDKTITDNKTVIAKDVEREICSKLINLCLEINMDESELDGMGNTALINLLLKTTLLQRDIINDLDYKVFKLEKQFKEK
jgi:hypothetical protein